jgi:peptidase inhibitor I78 family protein
MTGFNVRRLMGFGAVMLVGLLLSAAANAGACDARKARSQVGKSYSPRVEQKALELSGASTATLVGQGFAGTADYRTDRVDLWLDHAGDIEAIDCG